ncbi:YheC/YheD family protein [Paenibacillus sp. 1781tsa1]|nr:YheC/YheD family protein [Paenibacillus sp. 1781tsa1]MCP1187480.1 YheC/YheD family protein [Paenibacillus sp. 1781tsa1]
MLFERDKWLQYGILRDEPSLAERLPETRLIEKHTLTKMLLQYPSVVLKPRNGSYGRGILFIKRSGANAYRIQNENNTVTMRDNEQLLDGSNKQSKVMNILSKSVCSLLKLNTGRSTFGSWFSAKRVPRPLGT